LSDFEETRDEILDLALKTDKYCPFCSTKMSFKQAELSMHYPDVPPHIDITMKCTNCYFVAMFGVPLTLEQYLYFEHRFGKSFMAWGSPTEKDTKIIVKRLRALGYYPEV